MFLELLDSDCSSKPTRRKYADGLSGGSKFKNTGVKKCFVVGVAPDLKEEFDLLEDFFENLNLPPVEFQFCPDLKMANLATGLGPHSSKHPSPFCDWERNTENPCNLRTFEGNRQNYEAWKKDGSDPKRAKEFFNCVRAPWKIFPKIGRVIDFIVLMALHIFLGVFNKLYFEMEKEFPQAKRWPQRIHVVAEDYFGKFEGMSLRKSYTI